MPGEIPGPDPESLKANVDSSQKAFESYEKQYEKADSSDQVDTMMDAAKGMRNSIDARDANLWRANQHKEQNLDGYIDTAKQQAEAEGKEINLGDQSPEQPGNSTEK